MLTIDIEVPKPSRFVSHDTVDEVALACNRAYRVQSSNKRGYPVNMDIFIDLLEISTLWEDIEEPEDTAFFANYSPADGGLITINKKHGQLFEARPDVYCACLGHEGGHCVLRHWEQSLSDDSLPLFSDIASEQPRLFHKSSWNQYGLSREEVEKQKEANKRLTDELVRKAFVSETARQALDHLRNRYEPEWMFRQAEHFSLCLRIPQDHLREMLEEGWDFNSWSPVYRLAERFGVSGTMMKIRLEKLQVIEIGPDGRPRPCPPVAQARLFN